MKIKQLVQLSEQQPLDLHTFYTYSTQTGKPLSNVATFLIRLDRLRNKLNQQKETHAIKLIL